MALQHHWLGLTPFDQSLAFQGECLQDSASHQTNHILGLEHPLVLTLGLRSHEDPALSSYYSLFPEVKKIRRGGHLVIHNPGQLVIYPIINLKSQGLGVKDYLCLLTKTTKAVLTHYNIYTHEKVEPGLFTENGKIAMFGVGVNRGITQHGLCINISNELSDFKKIAICNVQGEAMDRVHNHGSHPPTQEVYNLWIHFFNDFFETQRGHCS